MLNSTAFIILLLLSVVGFILGAYYYLRPEKIVRKRVKSEYLETANKEQDFKKWLDAETKTQVIKIRRLGLMIMATEGIWLVLIIALFTRHK